MATPSELSLAEVRKYLLDNNGCARNRDLVKHFKSFLTDPETRVEARNKFKEYVNTLATIKTEDGEKYLVLKKKYLLSLESDLPSPLDVQLSSESLLSPSEFLSPTSPSRNPPPYRPPPPPPPLQNSSYFEEEGDLYAIVNKTNNSVNDTINYCKQIPQDENNWQVSQQEEIPPVISDASSPPVPPRRKSHDKLKLENKENIIQGVDKAKEDPFSKEEETKNGSSSELPSVRERMQRFNRMASETDLHGRTNSPAPPTKKRPEKGAADEEDNASVGSQLDGKAREWLVRAAQGDYQALAKLAAVEPRLTKLKDPCSTALHWGAKHGNENIVKLIAGTYKDYIKSVNETTNGGYTALHIAMQFEHENIFNLLVQVYGANQEIRDHSGRKARQYLTSQEAAVSNDTFRKIKARKKNTEKDLGFLRIGSLNVRVKRTTEAFSQFLGVATSTATNNNDKIHKSWGSADNIQEPKLMPPPKYAPIKKRKSRRATQDFVTSRTSNNNNTKSNNKRPSSAAAITPTTQTPIHDSDSDGACGFDSAWRPSPKL